MSLSGGSGSSDPTMLELFGAEVDMHLPVLSEGLLALEKGRAGKKEIESMMRAAHSIKGAARIVGIDPAVRIAHVMEDCLTAAKEERITLSSEAVDVLLQGVDALQRTCTPDSAGEMDEGSIASLVERISRAKEGKASPPPTSSPVLPSGMEAAAPSNSLAAPLSGSIVFPGVFDNLAAETVRGEFCAVLENHPERIRIDFGQVEHLGVAALALLLSFAGEAKGEQLPSMIEAYGVAPALRGLFRVVGLESSFAVVD